jgi:hypothetical protein
MTASTRRRADMDTDRVEGTAKQTTGNIKEGLGKAVWMRIRVKKVAPSRPRESFRGPGAG